MEMASGYAQEEGSSDLVSRVVLHSDVICDNVCYPSSDVAKDVDSVLNEMWNV